VTGIAPGGETPPDHNKVAAARIRFRPFGVLTPVAGAMPAGIIGDRS
jgi:hypothetical protein